MKREIKFRVWNDIKGKFISPLLMDTSNANLYYYDMAGCGGVIQQYTGLTDKNGVEIYEGDVIRFYDEEDGRLYNLYCKYTLENAWFSFLESFENDYDGYYWMEVMDKCEVIGNIHENPELMG